jgi:hypothetical protein
LKRQQFEVVVVRYEYSTVDNLIWILFFINTVFI